MKILMMIAASLVLAEGGIAHAESVDLVKGGKSSYVIVLGPKASLSEKRGAEEIARHLKQMSGAELKIVTDDQPAQATEIVIGLNRRAEAAAVKPDMKALGNDGFVLKTVGPKVFIVGSPVRGTMYGCSELLERLGVRWYTAKVTKLPKSADLSLASLDVTQTPDFEYREPYVTEAWDKDWAARNRVVGHFPRLDESTGGKISYVDFVHSLDRLIPPAIYDKHPEYFPIIKGKRANGYVQRCLSNPDVLKLAIEGVRAAFKASPTATITTVSQNDTANWCECPECSKLVKQYGEQSGVYVWFVNQIAQAIEKEYPDKLIDTLAYQFTEAPPTNIKPRDNVRIRLCPLSSCQTHPYEQCTHENNKKFVERLKGWHKLADVLYVWHYTTDFANYLMPFPDFKEFPAETRLYKKNGVKGIFFQGAYCGPGGSDSELRAYVMTKLLWNVNTDTDAEVSAWMQGVYGNAWKPMRQWFDLVHQQFEPADAHLFCYNKPQPKRLTPEVLAKGDALFAEAEKLAQTDLQREYIKKNHLGLTYVQLDLHPDTGPKLKQFMADIHSLGITNTSEPQTADQWEQAYVAQHQKK